MGARIRIFGVNFVAPKGLRKSPGTNRHASCVATKLYGQKGGGRAGVRSRFVAASKACAGGR